ncbi:hypothetical protein QOZ80_1AG0001740 [Eleusine coracana subsp. coracana]|nr:hypothetical protein QOZ80_1AG0001740 [Eleusine coracana subsp. coracana]
MVVDCIGAIDGTHIHARVPARIAAAFRGRKHYTTQNVLAAVDFDLRFTYVLAGWEGSTHDAHILADALERDDGLRVPPDEVFPDEAIWEPNNNVNVSSDVVSQDENTTWGSKRDELANLMWSNRMAEEVVHVENDVEVVEAPVVTEQRGVRTDKGFKEVHLNQVAKSLQEFTGNEAQPKDAEYLNKPIENYKQMMTIFRTGLATGKYAMGSNEALGTPFVDSASGSSGLKNEPFDEEKVVKFVEEMAKAMGEASKEVTSVGPPPNKRRRTAMTEEDSVVLCSMTEAVKDVVAAIRETKVEAFNPELYGAVIYMPGFSEEALICAFFHLVDNKAQDDAFVQMTEPHRVLWLHTWLAKHYYL